MNTFATMQERPNTQERQLDSFLIQGILEGFVDGVLVLTEKGECIHSNQYARQICNQLDPNLSQPNLVPIDIWRACQALIDSRPTYPNQLVIMESKITTDTSTAFRIRARWIKLGTSDLSYILVTLEDEHQSTQNIANLEAQKYGLTPRQAEVWLLRRANYTHKEIASKLFITPNTVKKHMKDILAKQEMVLHQKDLQAVR